MKKFSKILTAGLVGLAATALTAVSAMASGDIYVMFSTNVMSLDTNLATDGDSFEIIADCIDGLTQMDAEGAAIPAIAESWDVSDDGMTYTFHLRDDAVWSNGEPVTANDFVFAWKLAMTANAEYGYMFDNTVGSVKNADAILYEGGDPDTLGVTAVDDKTLQVELENPVSFFPSLMYFPTFYPINQAFYESCGDGEYGTSPSTFLSNGAFILSDYTPGAASMTVTKNPDYYDADKVSLDSITYQVVQASDQALNGFRSKNLDISVISGEDHNTYIGHNDEGFDVYDGRDFHIIMRARSGDSASLWTMDYGTFYIDSGRYLQIYDADGALLMETDAGDFLDSWYASSDARPERMILSSGEWPNQEYRLIDYSGRIHGDAFQTLNASLWKEGHGRYVFSAYTVSYNAEYDYWETDWSHQRFGVCDEEGSILLEARYNDVKVLDLDRFWVRQGARSGMIDAQGHWYYSISDYESLMD